MTRSYGIAPPGYELPAATRLGRVKLQVGDLDRSLEYYERVLGLRVTAREGNVLTLGSQGDDSPLIELHEKRGVKAVPRRGLLGLYHYAILLPDRASLGRFLSHLGESGEKAGMSDHFVSEAVYLTDPDGLGIEVYADKPRSEWRHEDGQLAMTTIPLDVRSVVAAGRSEPWTGMPPGTVIGHVHLFVSDLARAAAFYHAALGFAKTVWSYPGALFMAAGGYHHHLGTNTWAQGASPATDSDARMLEWTIVVPARSDASAAASSLELNGVSVERTSDGWRARDPWGVAVRIAAAA